MYYAYIEELPKVATFTSATATSANNRCRFYATSQCCFAAYCSMVVPAAAHVLDAIVPVLLQLRLPLRSDGSTVPAALLLHGLIIAHS
jgi:hypothetical protein